MLSRHSQKKKRTMGWLCEWETKNKWEFQSDNPANSQSTMETLMSVINNTYLDFIHALTFSAFKNYFFFFFHLRPDQGFENKHIMIERNRSNYKRFHGKRTKNYFEIQLPKVNDVGFVCIRFTEMNYFDENPESVVLVRCLIKLC